MLIKAQQKTAVYKKKLERVKIHLKTSKVSLARHSNAVSKINQHIAVVDEHLKKLVQLHHEQTLEIFTQSKSIIQLERAVTTAAFWKRVRGSWGVWAMELWVNLFPFLLVLTLLESCGVHLFAFSNFTDCVERSKWWYQHVSGEATGERKWRRWTWVSIKGEAVTVTINIRNCMLWNNVRGVAIRMKA